MATAIRLQTIPDAIENSILLFYSLLCFILLRKLFRLTMGMELFLRFFTHTIKLALFSILMKDDDAN